MSATAAPADPPAASAATRPATPGRFTAACRVADVPPGAARSVEAGGRSVAIVNVAGIFHALDGECAHAGGPLGDGQVGGCQLACPWHGAVFDVRTGAVIRGPARKPVRTYQVKISDGMVHVAVG